MSASCCGPNEKAAAPWVQKLQTALTAVCGVALGSSFIPGMEWAAYVSVAAGAYFALRSAWDSLRARSIDVNFLMVLAAGGAIAIGEVRDAAALLFLFSLSSTLESMAMTRTQSAIEGLVKLRPNEALRVSDGKDTKVPVGDLRVGDTVRVLPFEGIPADGLVLEGQTSINQAAMTGESVPVARQTGEKVLAGTQNLEGMLLVSVTSEVGTTTLDRIVELVREAQENKASGERISSWFGTRYTIFVVAAFLVSLAVRSLIGAAWSDALYASLTLLVALSPCALVISTPATTLTALAWAARNGLLIRGGEYIELAAKVDTIAVDKTGTLTRGRPELYEICVCSNVPEMAGGPQVCVEETACWKHGAGMSPDASAILAYAAAVEQYSTHPIAEAIVRAAHDRGLDVAEAVGASAIPGMGVEAKVGGRLVRAGQRRYFEQSRPLDPHFAGHVEEIQRQGMTVVILQVGEQMAALGLRDAPREEAPAFLAELKALGVETVMLTGDTEETASAIADELKIPNVRSGLLPHDKTEIIAGMVEDGRHVMMVGDGINDAPSLAKATIGVAMGGLGSDIALNSADVVVMHDRLDRIPQLIMLGKRTNRVIAANLVVATGVIALLTLASVFWRLPLPLTVIGHEGSTVLVILNGLRLLGGPGRS